MARFSARGGWNQTARVFNHITWQPFAELAHPLTLTSPKTAVVYMEVSASFAARHLSPSKYFEPG
jgi:hypothetical protein